MNCDNSSEVKKMDRHSLAIIGAGPAGYTLAQELVKTNAFDIDIFDIDGEYYISEVNPRFGGGYPHAYECGCNHMKLIKNNLIGVANEKNIGAYEEGIYMMKYNEVMIRRKES